MKEKTRNILDNAYFIGGSPCSGKSTLAEFLAQKYDFNYYKIDNYEMKHIKQATSDKEPTMYNYLQMDWEERLMRSPEKQAEELLEFYRERFNMILSDLEQYSSVSSVILEGAALLPKLLARLEIKKNKIVYMIPSKEFQVKHYSKRSFIERILSECKVPEQAFDNWMERDHQFGKLIMDRANRLGYKVIYVDGESTIEQNIMQVEKHFALK